MRQIQKPGARPTLSGTSLKRIACASMLLDHIGASCIEGGVLASAGAAAPAWQALDLVLRHAGRLAFPLFCFLLVEGFLHTHSVRRYAVRLLVFAIISEAPFDWAFYRTPVYTGHQNVYWTLLLGLLAMAALHYAQTRGTAGALVGAAGALGCVLAAVLMQTDYGAAGVLFIVGLYAARETRRTQCAVGAALACCLQPTVSYALCAGAAFALVLLYSGERGRCGRGEKWAFYAFYPLHLVALGCVTNLLL